MRKFCITEIRRGCYKKEQSEDKTQNTQGWKEERK